MFCPSRLSLLCLLLVAVTIIQPGDAFVWTSTLVKQPGPKFTVQKSPRSQVTQTQPVPSIAATQRTFDSLAQKTIWQRLSLSFWKRVIRKRVTRFLLLFHCVVLALSWRIPTARAVDEVVVGTSMETIEMKSEERVVIQPLEIPSKPTVDSKTKSLVIAIGVSGATFTAIRHKKRHQSDQSDDLEERQKPNESDLVREKPFLQGVDDYSLPSSSSVSINETISTGTEKSLDDDDSNPNDQIATTDTNSLVIDDTTMTTTCDSDSILKLDDATKKELDDAVSIAKEWEFQQEEAVNNTYPLLDPNFVGSRRQPKSKNEEETLKTKYGQIDDVSERAYQILVDLGMVQASNPLNKTKFEGIIDMDK